MKNSILAFIFLAFAFSTHLCGQGWAGNSPNNLVAFNASLNVAPVSIGIGINTPTALLHTNGSLRFQGLTQTNNFNRLLVTDNNGNVNWRDISSVSSSDNDWNYTTNAPHMFSLNTGNVGIGINNPIEKLDLAGNIRLTNPTDPSAQMFIRPSIKVTGNLNPGIDEESTVSAQITNRLLTHLVIDILANDSEDSFAIRTDKDANGIIDHMAMVVKPNGNIGIGTNRPTSKLQINNGDIYIKDFNQGVIMKSPNGQCWKMTVGNNGQLIFTAITCP